VIAVTPETIRTRTFQAVKKNGYDPAEVQDFLYEVAGELEQLEATIGTLEAQNARLEEKLNVATPVGGQADSRVLEVLEQLKSTSEELIEQSKTNAAAISMRTEQDRRVLFDQARKEADIIIRDAEKKADAILEAAHNKVQEFRDEISILQARRIAIISRVKSLLTSQQQFLESLENDAIGQSRELTNFMKETGTQAGISADQLETILQKLEGEKTGKK
jgi:cell division initiation protein